MNEVLLVTRAVTVRFGARTALRAVTTEVRRGETLYVMGPSGCGKTTLVRCLLGLQRPSEGEVLVEGRELGGLGPGELEAYHRRLGMVFQGGALVSSLPLGENVALPMRAAGLHERVIREAVRMRLAQVGLLGAIDLLPAELSGGMRKRASIARALALEPELLLCDEPTSGLDPITADGIDRLLVELRESQAMTLVVVSHDLPSAERVADRVLVLDRAGEAAVDGDWEAVQDCGSRDVQDFLHRRAGSTEAPPRSTLLGPAPEREAA
ncbi:MAG: ABC transporter ATP-binding protein [Planctomycetota bacterium]